VFVACRRVGFVHREFGGKLVEDSSALLGGEGIPLVDGGSSGILRIDEESGAVQATHALPG
jgi:hypothetical protein